MGITAISGPQVVYGLTQTSSGAVTEYNEERGPSLFDLGTSVLDPRSYFNYGPGNPVGTKLYGIFDRPQASIDYMPFTANASAIVGSTQTPVAGTALTLTANSTLGVIQTTIIAPETGQSVSVLALDSTASVLTFGTGGTVAIWNPAAGTGRCISVLNGSNANTEQYIVRGRDMYGIKMTETILASTTSTGTGVGRKAFKYLQSVTPSTATTISATGVRVGFVDTYGFPIAANYLANTAVTVSTSPLTPSLVVLTSANATLASTVATATSTTPDARGTYSASAAFVSLGTSATIAAGTAVRFTFVQSITANQVAAITAADQSALFGITQFSDF